MALPDGITCISCTTYTNRHENFSANYEPNRCFNLRLPFGPNDHAHNYQATTRNFQWLIGHAIEQGITMRAIGNGWSFTDVAMCDGALVDTLELRAFFQLGDSFLAPEYLAAGKKSADLVFTQCGMSLQQLHKELEQENGWMHCLKASGASNGQTIAGATSTGTHGSAYRVGAVHDTIVGIHLVTGPDTHVWLERASYPMASDEFIQWLGAEKIADDDVFNAAVVSFGSFGFIHGLLIETEPIFLLKRFSTPRIPYDAAIKLAINQLDFSAVQKYLPMEVDGAEGQLYHFDVMVDPHHFKENDPDNGIYLKSMFKVPYVAGYPKPVTSTKKFQYGDDLLGVIQSVLDMLPRRFQLKLVPKLVSNMLPLAYAADEGSIGTIGEIFTNTKIRGKAASAAVAFPVEYSSRVIEEIVAINQRLPFAGAICMRFVKGSKALLGFTKYPQSCILEMDGVESSSSRTFFSEVWNRLEALNIPYTVHWGKINFHLNAERVRRMYGNDVIDKWIICRDRVLSPEARKVFTNAFMQRIGLDK